MTDRPLIPPRRTRFIDMMNLGMAAGRKFGLADKPVFEKQALLEADTLETRAETLIAMAEFEMAKGENRASPLN